MTSIYHPDTEHMPASFLTIFIREGAKAGSVCGSPRTMLLNISIKTKHLLRAGVLNSSLAFHGALLSRGLGLRIPPVLCIFPSFPCQQFSP